MAESMAAAVAARAMRVVRLGARRIHVEFWAKSGRTKAVTL
jgi:hypothetical protein